MRTLYTFDTSSNQFLNSVVGDVACESTYSVGRWRTVNTGCEKAVDDGLTLCTGSTDDKDKFLERGWAGRHVLRLWVSGVICGFVLPSFLSSLIPSPPRMGTNQALDMVSLHNAPGDNVSQA